MTTSAEKRGKDNKFPVFQQRFNSLRGDMTQGEFAKKIGVSRPTVGFYENGERLPDALILKRIAEKCEVSVDWLLGLTDVKKSDIDAQAINAKTGLSEAAIFNLMSLKRSLNASRSIKSPSVLGSKSALIIQREKESLIKLAALNTMLENPLIESFLFALAGCLDKSILEFKEFNATVDIGVGGVEMKLPPLSTRAGFVAQLTDILFAIRNENLFVENLLMMLSVMEE